MGEKNGAIERARTDRDQENDRETEGISLVSSSLSPMAKQGGDNSLISCIPIGNASASNTRSWMECLTAYYKPDGRDAA